MNVNVSFPEASSVRLSDLWKGNSFILSTALYRDYVTLYTAVETPCSGYVKCFNHNNGSIECLHGNCKVIEMVVDVHARPMTDKDRNDLPF